MAISNVSLTAGMRSNLQSIQKTEVLLARTQERLGTGKKVNSALDNALNFFAAKAHTDRASDFSARKDGMNESIQAIKAADNGIEGITSLIEQARGIISTARSTVGDTSDDTSLETQFNEVRTQIDNLVNDSGYKGTNLLKSTDSLVVSFNEDASNTLTVSGFDGSTTGLSISSASGFGTSSNLDTAETELTTALDSLRTSATDLSSKLGIVNARLDFTDNMIATLQEGADKLTLADTNEEGANMLALQTRQQLGTTSLSLAAQSAQSILRLF